jgi:hypothetical protein
LRDERAALGIAFIGGIPRVTAHTDTKSPGSGACRETKAA